MFYLLISSLFFIEPSFTNLGKPNSGAGISILTDFVLKFTAGYAALGLALGW
jgi:hypothetical protein